MLLLLKQALHTMRSYMEYFSRKLMLAFAVVCLLPFFIYSEPLHLIIEGEAGILINAETGAVLFEKDVHKSLFPASTTKIATALFALNLLEENLETQVVAEPESLKNLSETSKIKLNYRMPGYWLEPDGTHIAIKPHEELSFQALLEGMLIASGNDAANVIAQALGPTIPTFINKMNEFLKENGCLETTYYNPHGLHHPKHVTTAYDLARMTALALKNPVFCEIVGKARYQRPKTRSQPSAIFLQTNRLLRSGKYYYPHAIGVKTGYHSKSKKTFVGAARFEGRTLIAVLLGYKNKNAIFDDAIELFDKAFNQPKVEKIFLPSGLQTFTVPIARASNELTTYTDENLSLIYYPAEDPKVKCYLSWEILDLPIRKNQKVGELQLVSFDNRVLSKVDLKALNRIDRVWPYNWIENLKNFYRDHSFLSVFYLLCLICCIGFTYRAWLQDE